MQKTFAMDVRNIGGLRATADHLYKHQIAVQNAKPSINIKPPKPPVDQKQRQECKYNADDDFNNVLKTFKAVVQTKKIIDNNQPFMKKRTPNNKNKKEKFEQYEHEMNIKAQKRRIGSAGSMQERKKNQFDPIAHPPVFFRREGQNLSNCRLDNLMQYISKEQQQSGEKINLSASIKRWQRSKSSNKKSQIKIQQFVEETEKKDGEFVYDLPKLKGQEKKDYYELKKELIMIIFKHRIYKSDDLEALFGRLLIHNPSLHMVWIEDIFNEIREEFLDFE
ncbi:unnamed protein product [Paramecium pentaurelia]|uniref:Uncharacterized protein n=1 Tax=Paramecium pentaurelia TaxID=43138 RepID=A0A8S1SP24_9CILI|nr:unnamed protein product [Paramecium pentaurelia]